jgi:hypothetical protein
MRLRRLFSLVCLVAPLLAGCARDLIVAEVLQIPEQAPIYTRYNLWFTNPMKMDSQNMLKGEILPFGTEVVIDSATTKEICFTTVADGRKFRIKYTDDYRMVPADEYMRELFSTQNESDLTVGVRPVTIEKLKAGIVEKGMTKQEVELAYGPPCAFVTPNPAHDTWCFWTEFLVGKRIIFTKGVVTEILVL